MFQFVNIIGGLCLAITAVFTKDIPNVVANLLWTSIGMHALVRRLGIFRSTKKE